MVRKHRLASFLILICAVISCGAQALAATAATDSKTSPPTAPPAAHCVRGAIAAEERADRSGRDRLVEQALRAAPDFAPARWQAGQIRYDGQWLTVDAACEKGARDELLQQYHKLRSAYDDSPEAHLTLTRWCMKHHLTAEAMAHASRVLAARPNDQEVMKMLDLTWDKGELISRTELAQRKDRDEKARQAMQHWRPLLGAIRNKIDGKSAAEHDEGLAELAAVQDPAAIEALIVVFKNRASSLCEAIRVIGQMPGQEATDALLQQAILSKNENVGLAACQQLKTRSVYGYVPKLLAALSTPVETKFEVVRDGEGVHFRETVQRQGQDAALAKTVDTGVDLLTPNPNMGRIIGQAYADAILDTQMTAKANAKLNRKLIDFNESIYRVLDNTVGKQVAHNPEAWWDWWYNYNVMSVDKKPTYVDTYYNPVDVPYQPYTPTDIPQYSVAVNPPAPPPGSRSHSCFARGTKVWTSSGTMPIENVQIGDRVLSQSPLSGELTFKPVLDITVGHQPFLAIDAEGEKLVATGGHMFWVSGAGWRLARELKVGDRLHTVSGWSEIQSIQPVDPGETHNLTVADFNTYFVGDSRVLTHDITIPQMVTGGVPGELAAR
ncbi:MAG TPA: polymorphic toxin-type HINT domain-containing protein [Pirellulales bacterium]|jgi:hypothetical protein|nr:polymorphic toxin-type HINT domain-containing protein [Pirellulales bacterium]